MARLTLNQSQLLYNAVNDPDVAEALSHFFREQSVLLTSDLVMAVRMRDRDVMREAAIAGEVKFSETGMQRLKEYATRQMKEASQ